MADNSAAIQNLLDENEIRRVLAFYTDALNHRDVIGATSMFTEDAVVIGLGMRNEGRETVRQVLTGLMDFYSLIHQVAHSSVIQVNGDAAQSRTSLFEVGVERGSRKLTFFWAEMEDEWIRLPEGWRFTQRTLHMTGRGVSDLETFEEVDSVPLTQVFNLLRAAR